MLVSSPVPKKLGEWASNVKTERWGLQQNIAAWSLSGFHLLHSIISPPMTFHLPPTVTQHSRAAEHA